MAAIALVAVAMYAASAAGIAGTIAATVLTTAASIIGGLIDRALFASKGGGQSFDGPRTTDSQVSGSAYGQAIPLIYGTVRMGGNCIWAGPLVETIHTKKVKGGKGGMFGGGGGGTQTTYTYSRSFALAFGEGPIEAIEKMWADNKLWYDNGAQQVCGAVRVYPGDFTQLPDSLIQSVEGISVTPAYRGIAYVVLDTLQLADYGNRIPNIHALVRKKAGQRLSEVLTDIVNRTGITEYDVSHCSAVIVDGYIVGKVMDARSAVEPIIGVFNVLGVSRRTGLAFVSRDHYSLYGIDEDVIGVAVDKIPEGEQVKITRMGESDIPRELAVSFTDPDRDYQASTQSARRNVGNSQSKATVDLSVVMTNTFARQLAERYLFDASARRATFEEITLPPEYQDLDPGQICDIKLLGIFERVRIMSVKVGADGIVKVTGRFEDSAHLTSTAVGLTGVIPVQTAGVVPDTIGFFLDIPILRAEDDDWGWYFAADTNDQANWRGMKLYRSADGVSYDEVETVNGPGITGDCDTILPNAQWFVIDTVSTLDVTLTSTEDQLYSCTKAELLNYANFCAVGSEDDGWEILQYQTATLLAAGQYRLSNLLRGRRGTDHKTGTHVAGEKFVRLSDAAGMARISDAQSLVSAPRTYKPVSVNQSLIAVTGVPFTNTAIGKKPLSPCMIRGLMDTATGDIAITWINRSRIPNDWPDFMDVPLGEESERYELEVYDTGVLVRSETIVGAPTFNYTAAMQTADFGAPEATYDVRVSQLAGSGFAGYQRAGTVPTTFI